MRDLFASDAQRGERLTVEAAGLFFDYSKNRITDETIKLLLELARQAGLQSRSTPCSAATRSTSPRSARCCTWLCARRKGASIFVDGQDVVPEVHEVLDRMAAFSESRAQRRVEGPHRQAHSQRDQHRHRRLGPGAGDGL